MSKVRNKHFITKKKETTNIKGHAIDRQKRAKDEQDWNIQPEIMLIQIFNTAPSK